jgi:pyridoxine 4-dehydrogenase
LQTMTPNDAASSGTFKIGGDIEVNRLGFGAMRLVGPRAWGEPDDREEALRSLRRLRHLDVNFVDTADCYGPYISESLIREALHPYSGLLIATKGGLCRWKAGGAAPMGRPPYLRQCVAMSLRRLGVDRIDLWQLHRVDPTVSHDEQFGVIRDMRDEGLIRHVGLSEAGVTEIEAARRFFPVATVQNRFNLSDRKKEEVLNYCTANGIGFIPWAPLAAGDLTKPGSPVDAIAKTLGATTAQVALAWLLKRSPVMLPIPGTGKVKHLEENVAAASIKLSEDDFRALDEAGRQAGVTQ